MTEIVDRLRGWQNSRDAGGPHIIREAADEIERLRAALDAYRELNEQTEKKLLAAMREQSERNSKLLGDK